MFNPFQKTGNCKIDDERFKELVEAYLVPEDDLITLLANSSSLLAWYLDELPWVGFYLVKGDKLILGPFQGLPACTQIKLGVGVCGVSAKEQKLLNVADVSTFPTYIACEGAVRSELVVPLIKDNELLGVLDADSNLLARFTKREEALFSFVCETISSCL
ncbi:MAG: GAF domain-containing protein [Spirochaetales bacterium]|nr:GAF domain-containing protein [Spirochaetales bacterium]